MNQNIIQRTIFQKIWQEIDSHKIILLNGARQTGKTTLLKMIIEKLKAEKGINNEQIHYIDLENSNQLLIWDSQPDILKILPQGNKKHYFFIDEFQNAKTIGSTLKVIHDHYPNIKLIITGSASWYLNIDESLAGRKIIIPVWPFSFAEFINTQQEKELQQLYINEHPTENAIKLFNQKLIDFLLFGGYPEIILAKTVEQKFELLADLINSYLLKDIRIWNYSANTLEIKKLLSLLASQISSQLSLSSLSINSGLGMSIISNRLELLKNTFILHLLSPFFTNKQKEIVKSPKTFLIDTGIRNSLLEITKIIPKTADFGALAENFVITEFLKKKSVLKKYNFWRAKDGKEVDVILQSENKIIPIEVKSGNQKIIPSGLKSFIRQYNPKNAYVLNWSIIKDEKYQNCIVYFRPLWFADKI
ncbi:MAG: ATP-binding protein [Patescibacteria group bacterium]|nr:ATP-binding protein [Patescibacteria group bacterium]